MQAEQIGLTQSVFEQHIQKISGSPKGGAVEAFYPVQCIPETVVTLRSETQTFDSKLWFVQGSLSPLLPSGCGV